MLTQVKCRPDHATQLETFFTTLREIAPQYTWTAIAGCVRAFDEYGNRYCPLAAIVASLYYQEDGVDGLSAARYLGMSNYTALQIVNAADGAWDSAEAYDLNLRICEEFEI